MSRLFCVALGSLLFCCRPNYFQIQSEYAQGVKPPPPAYDNRAHWAALPTLKDAADSVPNKSNLKDQQAEATADVFFIHPTTFTHKPTNQFIWNADVNDAALNRKTQESTILNQASIFNGSCRVYAPYYRQAHYHAFITTRPEDARQALLRSRWCSSPTSINTYKNVQLKVPPQNRLQINRDSSLTLRIDQ